MPHRLTAFGCTAWTVTGAGLCLGVLSGFTIRIVVFPAAVLVVGVLLVQPGTGNGSAIGLVSGAGLVPLRVAYLNHSGPGELCLRPHRAALRRNVEPWPWLAVGLFLAAAGMLLFIRRHRATVAKRGRKASATVPMVMLCGPYDHAVSGFTPSFAYI
jgi:hypothetical protein